MAKTKKRGNRNMKKSYRRGGMLVTNAEMDLINTHICKKKEGADKEPPSLEVYTSISKAFQLNVGSLGYLMQNYRSEEYKWFKFVIINNDETLYIYILDGAKINKHSVAMLEGLLDVTKTTGEYEELRHAYQNLIRFKNDNGSNTAILPEEKVSEVTRLMEELDIIINRDIRCMPVVAAGSGSVIGDKICINTKSGHYKPTIESMNIARGVFEANTGLEIIVKEKENKKELKRIFGENAENFSGLCLPPERATL